MPENMTRYAVFAAKEQGIGAIPAFAMAYLRGRYNGGAFTKTVIDATMRRHYRLVLFVTFDFAGLSSNSLYNERVYRLYRY